MPGRRVPGRVRTVGILGGMGPAATIALQRLVLDGITADDDRDHVPLLVDMNPQVPSRIARLIDGDGDDPEPTLVAMARRLERAGAEALAMPCNTAHHYAPAIRAAVAIPLLDMIALAVDAAHALTGENDAVGLLGSPASASLRLFDDPLVTRARVPLWPADPAGPLAAIRRIKAGGPGEEARRLIATASAELAGRGAVVQIVACTEFSTLDGAAAPGVRTVDALDRLADAIVAFATGSERRAPGLRDRNPGHDL